jgi:hypothetical protein
MDDVLNRLRSDALFVRLSSIEHGGAITVDEVLSVFKSITESYKEYVLAKFSRINTIQDSKKAKKAGERLVEEASLLFVDLDFQSFGATLAPDTTQYQFRPPEIKNMLQWKKENFDEFTEEVFAPDYNNSSFLRHIEQKFTEEQRVKIYRPMIDHVINKSGIRIDYRNTSDQTHKLRTFQALKPETIQKLTPVRERVKVPPEGEFYQLYVKSSENLDLFDGKNMKVQKLLAAKKLAQPTYPYVTDEIVFEGRKIILTQKVEALVEYDPEEDILLMSFEPLNINVWAKDREELEEAFRFMFSAIFDRFSNATDSKLTTKARELKARLMALVSSVKVL